MGKYREYRMKMAEKDIDLIDKLNFENWIEENLQLVQYIAREDRTPVELHSAKRFGEVNRALTKKLNRGICFGVLSQTREGPGHAKFRGVYSLTAKAEKYLDKRDSAS